MNSVEVWDWEQIAPIISTYIQMVKAELQERIKAWPLDLSQYEMHEAVGALLARQVTLAVQLAAAPPIWNSHLAPLVLRSMTDTYISLGWILCDPVDRAQKFILYGLGQEKLEIEHLKARPKLEGRLPGDDSLIKSKEEWLSEQRYEFLTEVNVGSWSGIDTRKMADEAGLLDVYRYDYQPSSGATHSQWHHVGRYNLLTCPNPLHKFHKIPVVPELGADIAFLQRAAEYVQKTFVLFDGKFGVKIETPISLDALIASLDAVNQAEDEDACADWPDSTKA